MYARQTTPADGGPHGPPSTGGAETLPPWLRWVGHSGYVAEGLVYVLIGSFALVAALEPSQRPNGYQGALTKLESAPFGDALLALLALGLTAFVLWQLVLAILDPEHRRDRRTAKRLALRVGFLLNAALHTVLAGEAAWVLIGAGGGEDQGRGQAVWTAWAMSLPFGRWAIGATGAGIVLFGVFQFYRAGSRSKIQRVDLPHNRMRALIIALGVAGFTARGVLFGLIGVFLIDAARRYDASHATGVPGALNALRRQPYGHALLAAVAAGLVCYGLFQIIKEPYRNFRAS